MVHINSNFQRLPKSYLFSEISARINAYESTHPKDKVIKMGIGDVTLPIIPAVIDALHKAVEDLSLSETFHGYGPEQGYSFLRDLVAEHDFRKRGIDIKSDEIFISDGAKTDTANFVDLFDKDTTIAVTDPVYPVYVDSNVLAGRGGELTNGRWSRITYLPCYVGNDFIPDLPNKPVDLIYLCFPNNPTGTTLTKAQLTDWVDYARKNNSIILFDAAYEVFITEENVPHSIFEIEGAKECCIEFRSFSKTAGFTGVRCGYVVIPKELRACGINNEKISLHSLWLRRQTTKFNGASYITQRGAAAIYSDEGQKQMMKNISYYLNNASIITSNLRSAGYNFYGGISSPYVWIKTPDDMNSWQFFDYLLNKKQIVGTPGAGFGPHGEGYLRLSAFNTKEKTEEAMRRILDK